MNFNGSLTTVMGLGHFGGGVAAARWLAESGARVTVCDSADQQSLAGAVGELADCNIAAFEFGPHREENFRDAELVVVNPAVRPENLMLEVARRGGAQLSSEIELFMRACPAKIVGVTGSNGKSTTAAMIASISEVDGRRTYLGGNIGGSLLGSLEQITADDLVVLELSSFQLYHLSPNAPMAQVAVVTGFSPNHLDWHDTLDDYVAAKQRILTLQTATDVAVLPTYDPAVGSWKNIVRGELLPSVELSELPRLSISGEHNRRNAACAMAAARAVGCSQSAIEDGLRAFGGLSQRMELVAEIDGRSFYNDSAATTPESTISALRSIERPLWLLAGGRNKGLDLDELAGEIVRTAKGAAFFGSVGEQLRRQVIAQNESFPCVAVSTMNEALRWCRRQSAPGGAIVLSPGCASTDQFTNYRQRGEEFAKMVNCPDDLSATDG